MGRALAKPIKQPLPTLLSPRTTVGAPKSRVIAVPHAAEMAGIGVGRIEFAQARVAGVARMERSAIRDLHRRLGGRPGFRFASSGLRSHALCRSLSIGSTWPLSDLAASEARNTSSAAMVFGSIIALIDCSAI